MKAKLSALLILFLLPFAGAIVIVPPTIYFVTLSIATFIANSIIGLLAIIALSGLVDKKFFGRKLSEIFSFIFSAVKFTSIAIVSMLVALLIVNPVEINSVLLGSFLSAIVCCSVLLISDYSKYRVSDPKEKNELFKSTLIFSVFVLILFSVSTLTSIETKIIAGAESQYGAPAQDAFGGIFDGLSQKSTAPIAANSISNEMGTSAPSDYDAYPREAKAGVLEVSELWFQPNNLEECIINIGNQEFSFKPENNCYYYENGNSIVRTICPIKITIDEITQKGNLLVTASGSCSENTTVSADVAFRIEST